MMIIQSHFVRTDSSKYYLTLKKPTFEAGSNSSNCLSSETDLQTGLKPW